MTRTTIKDEGHSALALITNGIPKNTIQNAWFCLDRNAADNATICALLLLVALQAGEFDVASVYQGVVCGAIFQNMLNSLFLYLQTYQKYFKDLFIACKMHFKIDYFK